MYDIKELEEQWKRYRLKKLRPWIIAGILFTGSIITIFTSSQDILQYVVASLSEKKGKIPMHQELLHDIYLDLPIEEMEVKVSKAHIDSPIGNSDKQYSASEKAQTIPNTNALHIEVVETNKNSNVYKEVEKRFRLGHDPDDSLFLAKAYYMKGMYKKAEYWALQTNKINEKIEESWLIFVKAKVKGGQRNEAIRILNTYIGKTNSAEGRILLDKIKKEKL